MSLRKKTSVENDYRTLAQELEAGTINLELCQNGHIDIFHNVGVKCPLCDVLHLNRYYSAQSKELKGKYETLYKTALEFSPEILL